MAFYDKFPYTNFQELNLDRIIQELVQVKEGLQFVIDNASLKYADPIQWNITKQYQANTVVIDPASGIAYLSTKPVPDNIQITDTGYWTPIFDLGSLFDDLSQQITDEETARNTADQELQTAIDNEANARTNADAGLQAAIDSEETARANADTALQGAIDSEAAARAAADNALQNAIDSLDISSSWYDITKHGVPTDGGTHPLSEFYSTLADARAVYPFVTSLNQSIVFAEMQKGLNENQIVYAPKGKYYLSDCLTINNTTDSTLPKEYAIKGDGKEITTIVAHSGFVKNDMTDAVNGVGLTVYDLTYEEDGRSKTTTGILMHGNETYPSRSNFLRMSNVNIYGFARGIDIAYCGQSYFNMLLMEFNDRCFYLGRDASFCNWNECLAVNNGGFISAYDPAHDGISNGLIFQDCESVYNTGTDYFIDGWQLVYFSNCSSDLLQTANEFNIRLLNCQDFTIDSCWVAGTPNVAGQSGITLTGSHTGSICNCSLVNEDYGIRCYGDARTVTATKIFMNQFDTCNCDILIADVIKAIITGNIGKTAHLNSGTAYCIYLVNASKCIVTENIIPDPQYSIVSSGGLVANNLFA